MQNLRYCLQLFRITRDLRCQKRLWILGFSATPIKIRRFAAFCEGPLRKQKSLLQLVQNVMVCDWCISIRFVFLCFKFLCFWTSEFACFHVFYLPTKTWQVWIPKVKLFSIELLNPKQTQIYEGENESVRSGQHLILKLLLVIATFIWQGMIGCYGNGLTDVEEKPKILKRIWQRTSRFIRNSFKNTKRRVLNS